MGRRLQGRLGPRDRVDPLRVYAESHAGDAPVSPDGPVSRRRPRVRPCVDRARGAALPGRDATAVGRGAAARSVGSRRAVCGVGPPLVRRGHEGARVRGREARARHRRRALLRRPHAVSDATLRPHAPPAQRARGSRARSRPAGDRRVHAAGGEPPADRGGAAGAARPGHRALRLADRREARGRAARAVADAPRPARARARGRRRARGRALPLALAPAHRAGAGCSRARRRTSPPAATTSRSRSRGAATRSRS